MISQYLIMLVIMKPNMSPRSLHHVERRNGYDVPIANDGSIFTPSVVSVSDDQPYLWCADLKVWLSPSVKLSGGQPIFGRQFPLVPGGVNFESLLDALRTMFGEDILIESSFSFTNRY